MKNRIINYLRAGYPALYLVSHEESRIEHLCASIATETQRHMFAWSISKGRQDLATGGFEDLTDPCDILDSVAAMPADSFILLRDFHYFLVPEYPMFAVLVRKFKDALVHAKSKGICLIICAAELKLPPDLSKLVVAIDFELPDRDTLGTVLDRICESNDLPILAGEERTAILVAASGLTTSEAEDAFSLSLVEVSVISPEIIQREKANTIRKNGLLDLVKSPLTLADVGGLDNLKEWLVEKRDTFTDEAAAYGTEPPCGILCVGQPGTGKSLAAKTISSIFRTHTLRLEAGRLFGSLVGQSEGNWRLAHQTAKAVAPCIMWIDEVDGLFSGAGASGQTDGGTTDRVLKAIIQDMQDDSDGIFYVFTANDIDKLPEPLIDRLAVWNVDLPNHEERVAIWRIHIAKPRRKQTVPWNPDDYDIQAIATASEGFSGRQIEMVWKDAIDMGFNAKRPPATKDVLDVLAKTVPTSKTMATQIEARRRRLEGKAHSASKPLSESYDKTVTRRISKK